jgi:hypothetical protein
MYVKRYADGTKRKCVKNLIFISLVKNLGILFIKINVIHCVLVYQFSKELLFHFVHPIKCTLSLI